MTGSNTAFHGSYAAADVTFLLTPVTAEAAVALHVDPQRKEGLIQTGARHYSEMITPEVAPSPEYMAIFEASVSRHCARMAAEAAALVRSLDARIAGPITLASLVRAGVPLGVLLRRGLHALGRDVTHFGMSIIRDRGLDNVALDHILARRPAAGLVFVDGWTGKGAISDELERSLGNRRPGVAPRLVVQADPAGRAWLSASFDDWLIPSGILGSTVSGLISRSILNARLVPPGAFHAAIHWTALAPHDVSRAYVDRITVPMLAALPAALPISDLTESRRQTRDGAASAVDGVARIFAVTNRNRIKPGIAEATRAVLRRAPERILVTGAVDDIDLSGLLHLARTAGVIVEHCGGGLYPYRAITLIRQATGAARNAVSPPDSPSLD